MMAALAQRATVEMGAGQHVFGVPGLTTGAVGIMTMILGAVIVRWVQGMADRRRADNENLTAVSGASDVLFKNLTKEVERLTLLVERQDQKIVAQDAKIMAQDKRISELERELAESRLLADNLSKDALGVLRNAAQADLSTIAVIKKEGGEK